MLRLLAIHGISTPGAGFSRAWAEPLFGAGIPVRLDEAIWPSTGSVVGDLTRVMTDDGFRRAALQAVRDAIARLRAASSPTASGACSPLRSSRAGRRTGGASRC
jgi:hypothetical protein